MSFKKPSEYLRIYFFRILNICINLSHDVFLCISIGKRIKENIFCDMLFFKLRLILLLLLFVLLFKRTRWAFEITFFRVIIFCMMKKYEALKILSYNENNELKTITRRAMIINSHCANRLLFSNTQKHNFA